VIYQVLSTQTLNAVSIRALPQTLSTQRKHCPFLALAFLLLLAPIAQASLDPSKDITQFVHQSWGSEQGLPQSSVTAIAQTQDGYLWLGTESGLARFDGLHFTIFEKSNTPILANSFITSLLTDHEGTLWIGTHGGGLAYCKHGQFGLFALQKDLANNYILSLYEDKQGSLWIGTDGGGLARFHGSKLQKLTKKDGLADNSVFSITGGGAGTLWIGTHSGLTQYAGGALRTYTARDGLTGGDIRSIYADPHGFVWIGTSENGLLRWNPDQPSFSKVNGLAGNSISFLHPDAAGALWVGTLDGGINRLVGPRISSFSKKDGLPGPGVWTLLEDRTGTLWLGGTEGGLTSIREGTFTPITAQQGLAGNSSLAIYQDKAGAVWIGSDGGLTRWKDGQTTRYTTRDGLPNNLVFSVTQDGAGNLWAGTLTGLARLENGKFRTFTAADGLPAAHSFLCVYTDRHGSLWAGSRGGLSHFDGRRFSTQTAHDGLPDKLITSIYQDARDTLWIGTDGGGLLRWQDGRLRTYTEHDGLPSGIIYSILGDPDETLWLGTNGMGLVRLANGKFTSYTKQNGLIDDTIFEILDGGEGRLWMASNHGIASAGRNDLTAFAEGKLRSVPSKIYGVMDGMKSRECNGGFQPAGWRAEDGHLWFPTLQGVAVVNPHDLSASKLPFPVIVERILADNAPVSFGGGLVIPSGKKRFEFQFTAPGSEVPEKLQFSYMLEGFDKDWVQSGSRGVANYTNISPASYRFRVLACIDGQCTSNGAGLSVVIQPAFYETRVFLFLSALLLGGCAFGLHRIHIRQLKGKERKLQKLVDERTRELRESRDQLEVRVSERTRDLSLANEKLESEICVRREAEQKAEAASRAKSEFLTNMSHELRTPINGIMGMTDIVMSTNLDPEQMEYLDIVKTSADSLLRIVSDILDFSRIETRKLELESAPFELSECLDQIMRLVSARAHEKGLRFAVNLTPDVPGSLIGDGDQLRQVLLNLLDNAIKFTREGSVSLKICLENVSDSEAVLRFAVADTGMGIPKEKQKVIFDAFSQADNSSTRQFGGTGLGLTIASQLVRLMNGVMWVDSEPECGSTFHFTAKFALSPAICKSEQYVTC
jgi:signal transduction histidine kinase/ligand-binding sensor domain-containing protein